MDEITIEQSSSIPSGSYGEVSQGFINDGNIRIALKKYKTDLSSKILDADIIKEIIILQHLNQYPETSTVELFGICFDSSRRHCFLVLEPLETDLNKISIKYSKDASKNNGKFNNREYKIIFYKCLKALNAIHSLGFIHNDIKLPNIMLTGTDIKFIDFGLSKYIGLSPLYSQVNKYMTTDVVKAPEKRISFATDIFSMASTMLHLVMRQYRKYRVDSKSDEIYDADNSAQSYNGYFGSERNFGQDGLNLLIKLLKNDPKIRLCANEALLHPYFDEIRGQNIEINRSVVGLLGGNPLLGLTRNVTYTEDNYKNKNLELCYYEELHLNYMDNICPIQFIENDIQYHTLIDWLLPKLDSGIFYGIDPIINGIIMINNNFKKYQQKKSQISPIINDMYIDVSFNMLMLQDIFSDDARPDIVNILENRFKSAELLSYFYNNLNINIDMYPISVHIYYIYLQLLFEIKQLENGVKIENDFFEDICIFVIFWFIQTKPYYEPVTNWEVVIFSTINLLSKILGVSGIVLTQNPIIPILTMDANKYKKMEDYYYLQFLSIDFKMFKRYQPFFWRISTQGTEM
jgi:tRNA A-37 threonylcarbamoyl transferase component Bud32